MKKRRNADLYALLLSIIYVLLGLVLIIWPEQSAITICYTLGALIAFVGVFYIIAYFAQNHYTAAIPSSFAFGISFVVVGIFVLMHAAEILKAMPFMCGLLVVFDSASKIESALDMHRVHAMRWKTILLIGIIIALLGLILMWNPFTSAPMLNIFIGVSLVINAVFNLISSLLIAHHYVVPLSTQSKDTPSK